MKAKSIFIIVLLSLVTVETYLVVRQAKRIENIKKAIPVPVKGDKVDYFELTGAGGNAVDNTILKRTPCSLVFIFEQPCSRCNKNIGYWKKAKSLVGDKIPVYGIVLDHYEKMIDFYQNSILNFSLYAPVDKEEFLKRLRIKLNLAQTIILKGDRVESVKIGNLNHNDFLEIVKLLKNTIGMEQT